MFSLFRAADFLYNHEFLRVDLLVPIIITEMIDIFLVIPEDMGKILKHEAFLQQRFFVDYFSFLDAKGFFEDSAVLFQRQVNETDLFVLTLLLFVKISIPVIVISISF